LAEFKRSDKIFQHDMPLEMDLRPEMKPQWNVIFYAPITNRTLPLYRDSGFVQFEAKKIVHEE